MTKKPVNIYTHIGAFQVRVSIEAKVARDFAKSLEDWSVARIAVVDALDSGSEGALKEAVLNYYRQDRALQSAVQKTRRAGEARSAAHEALLAACLVAYGDPSQRPVEAENED